MNFLSLIVDDNIIDQIPLPKGLTEKDVIDIDTLLRKANILGENQEIVITTLI